MKNYLPAFRNWHFKPIWFKISLALICLLLADKGYSNGLFYHHGNNAPIVVHGKVTDSLGNPIAKASVIEKGTTTGTVTNDKGDFVINVSRKNALLTISSVGFITKDVQFTDENFITVTLKDSRSSLDEIVVIGYGTSKKGDLTGSISSIKGSDINAAPVSNVVQGLEGKIAGVNVTNTSGGKPGGDITIRIRGFNSINSGNGPLYVIDGFPGVGDLNSINPNEIASVDILKDASATAIYGARGANGVVLITTKKGAAGKTVVNFDYSQGIQAPLKLYHLIDATQFAEVANIVNEANGLSPVFSNPASFGVGTDWQRQLFNTAPLQNAQLSISGGDQKMKFTISAGYFSQDGIEIGSGYKRTSLSTNIESKISDKFTVGAYIYGAGIVNNADDPAATSAALTISPILTVKDSTGRYLTNSDLASKYGFGFYSKGNPIAMANVENTTTQTHVLANTYLQYKIIPSLTFKTTFGADIEYGRYGYYEPNGTPDGGTINVGGTAQLSTSKYVSWLNENTLTYDKHLNDRNYLNIVGGITFQGTASSSVTATAEGFTDDFYKYNNLSLGSIQLPSSSTTDSYQLNSYFIRGNYELDNKYLATFTSRIDGSSRFGENNKYGFFPSGAIGWRVSQEDFMKQITFISNLKLRASYGITGNQDIGSFQSLANIGGTQYILGGQRVVGAQPITIANPDLKWEKTAQFDLGIDVAFFKDRLSITADYYNKITSDLLLEKPVPASSGFTTSLQNAGKVGNKGIELSINSVNVKSNDFQWNTGFNITFNRNKVLNLGGTDAIISNGYLWYFGDYSIAKVGYPIGEFYTYKFEGIWQTSQAAEAAKYGEKPGDPKFEDVNHDGVINSNDLTMVGSAQPDFTYGFSSNLTYKSFDFGITLNGTYGNKVMNDSYIDVNFPNGTTNLTTDAFNNRWTPTNPSNTHMRIGSDINPSTSSEYLESGSFLEISNVVLGYNLPKSLTDKIKLSKVRIYASVQDLYTFTKYTGYNPEANAFGADNLRLGYDYSYYPLARTFNLGINVTF